VDFDEAEHFYTIHFPDSQTVEACTAIVSVGVRVNPVIDSFAIEKDRKGRIMTDGTMRSVSRAEVWALGDCAHIPDPQGKPYPQLAQHALREAKVLAENISNVLRNQATRPFTYQTLGTLAALGHLKGVGRIGRFKVRGFLAWWIWRTYYLLQMPRWNRRVRIIFDWTIALMFKNDIVELDVQNDPRPQRGLTPPAATPPKAEPVERIDERALQTQA
jgi:NADH dehydrogenase